MRNKVTKSTSEASEKTSLMQISPLEIKVTQVIKRQDIHVFLPGKSCRCLSVHETLSGSVCLRKQKVRMKTDQSKSTQSFQLTIQYKGSGDIV